MERNAETIETPPTAQAEVSLQQQLEQIEAALSEAHGVVDNIVPRPVEPAAESGEVAINAEATGYRVITAAQGLIARLTDISRRVGTL